MGQLQSAYPANTHIPAGQQLFDCEQCPQEIWEQIFKHLSQRDRKIFSLLSKNLQSIVRPIMWRRPDFPCRVGLSDLWQLAQLKFPIRALRLSQLTTTQQKQPQQDLVSFLMTNFPKLESFMIDYKLDYYGTLELTCTEFEKYLRLPVTHIETSCFVSGNPHTRELDIDRFIDLLHRAKRCRRIVISSEFHDQLSIGHWRRLIGLPIREIRASFNKPFRYSQPIDMEEYDSLVGQITPPPVYSLETFRSFPTQQDRINPEQLVKLKRTRISHINLKALNQLRQVRDYVFALQENAQCPLLTISSEAYAFGIRPSDLGLLMQFQIRTLDCTGLRIDRENADQFTEMILNHHARWPIRNFVTGDRGDFNRNQMRKFRWKGLIQKVTINIT